VEGSSGLVEGDAGSSAAVVWWRLTEESSAATSSRFSFLLQKKVFLFLPLDKLGAAAAHPASFNGETLPHITRDWDSFYCELNFPLLVTSGGFSLSAAITVSHQLTDGR
jgi:hypothetical protein